MSLAPGFYPKIGAAQYHADELCDVPTLSSSIAKTLLSKTPRHAKLAHPRLRSSRAADDDERFDLGSVAHELILGKGGSFDVHDFADWRTKAAKEARATSRAAGRTPVLAEQMERAEAMMVAFWDAAGETTGFPKLDEVGNTEVVGIWKDVGGPMCRMMLDWWPEPATVLDIKTTDVSLSDASLGRLIENLSYDLSASFYLRGLAHLSPDTAGRVRWVWVFIEASQPHEVRIVEATNEQIGRGHRKAALAIAKWQQCMESGKWPGYAREIVKIEAPGWAETAWDAREADDPDFARVVSLDQVRGA